MIARNQASLLGREDGYAERVDRSMKRWSATCCAQAATVIAGGPPTVGGNHAAPEAGGGRIGTVTPDHYGRATLKFVTVRYR